MEPKVYNDLMEIIETQDRIIDFQKTTIAMSSRLIELKNQRLKVKDELILTLKKEVELLKK